MSHDTADMSDADDPAGFGSDAAAVFAVLSECWKRPTASIVMTVNEGALHGMFPDVEDVHLGDLRGEYTRLLLGPGPQQTPPYESVYRNRGEEEEFGPVNGAATQAVLKWYRTYGVTPAEDESELPDHIAIELEFAAYLADTGNIEACEQFLDEHLRQWTDEFLSSIREQTRSPFYEALAMATETAITMDLPEA